MVFAIAFKVYSTFSGRCFQADLDSAVEQAHPSQPVRYNMVFDCFENPAVTPNLKAMIEESSRSLKSVEVDFPSTRAASRRLASSACSTTSTAWSDRSMIGSRLT